MMMQDLVCSICHAEEHETSLEEMGIIGSEALFKALQEHEAHVKREASK